jgi:hypothetical protein
VEKDIVLENETEVYNPVYSLAAAGDFLTGGASYAVRPNGLLISHNEGENWQDGFVSLDLIGQPGTFAVALSPDYLTDRTVFVGAMGGVLRSEDGGQTWRAAILPNPPPVVSSLVFSPAYTEDGTIFAGSLEDGIFCSNDRGVHWSAWNFGLIDLSVQALALSPNFSQDQTAFAAAETGIFRSHNGGRAWREIGASSGLNDLAPYICLAVSPQFETDHSLFAGTESQGLLRLHEDGSRYERLGADVFDGAINTVLLVQHDGRLLHLLVAAENGIWVSRDDGKSWTKQAIVDEVDEQEETPVATAVCAPTDLEPGAAILAGFSDGSLRRMTLH